MMLRQLLPEYISRYNGSSRLRNSNLDSMSYVFNNAYLTSNSRSKLYKSFYYRVILIWNTLEFNARNIAPYNRFLNVSQNVPYGIEFSTKRNTRNCQVESLAHYCYIQCDGAPVQLILLVWLYF